MIKQAVLGQPVFLANRNFVWIRTCVNAACVV